MKHAEYSVAEARDKLARLVHEAEHGRPVRITRRGKPVAVLISQADYLRVHGRSRTGLGHAILAWRAKYDGIDLSDREIADWQDRSTGRVPDL